MAKEACAIVDRIRDEEKRTIWTSEFEDHIAQETGANVYPGMMFSLAKERMEKTKLWQIIRKMPKGALLHAHMDAMVDFDYLYDVLLKTPGMHIQSPTPLATSAALESSGFKFRFFKAEKGKMCSGIGTGHLLTVTTGINTSIWSPEYALDTPVLLTKAADAFPNGGRNGFLSWLKDRTTITHNESIEHHHGVDAVWRKFQSCFIILNSVIFYEPIFKLFMRRMMQQLVADGVKWVDLRLAFAFFYYREGSEEPEPTYDRMFKIFGEEVEKFKASEEGEEFWGTRIIWTGMRLSLGFLAFASRSLLRLPSTNACFIGLRALDTRKIVEDMDACIAIKLAYPHLVSGYDLVGQEDPGRPLKDLLPELFWFKKQCVQEGIELPFFFHAGETLGDGSDTDQNLFDAVLLGTRRIGHGFSLFKHPLLIDSKCISCPISGEATKTTQHEECTF